MSDAVKTMIPRAVSSPGTTSVSSLNAPSIALPLRFLAAGLLALFTGVVLLVLRPEMLATYHYNQYVIAVTHLFVLGWICTVVMGAMYQLVPVALETRLHSERLAAWQFALHLVGFAGMVWMFWAWNMKQVGHFGCVLTVGVGLFVYNIARTLLRVPRWNVVAAAIASALGWLSLAVCAGLTIAVGKCSYDSAAALAPGNPFGTLLVGLKAVAALVARFDQISAMHAHAHLGALGVFVMLIVGISYKLVPMFTLSEIQSPRRAGASVLLLNVGLLGSFVAVLLRHPLKMAFALVVVAGLACFGIELLAILRARKRATLDWGMRYFLTALSLLGPLAILALGLSWPGLPLTALTGQLENVYGFLALMGVVSFAIIGMFYKILPFLVWYGSYSRQIGLCKVPSLADLYSPALQVAGYWLYVASLAGTSIAIVLGNAAAVRGGLLLLGLGLGTLALNVIKILSHLIRPQIQPLTLRRAAAASL
ncbi:MAG TPA: cbb3-type cytochrome c oxidase subunit I [Candidatus Paceibacterota bacterium]|nr:cbb3-type cytochrome c oxidase subunit I [Verrucomicrobiota bacterium]HSA11077.1 cbb3-type cytochrome c oxidase subunit I [Candidatus Paceibacterota bacterium]